MMKKIISLSAIVATLTLVGCGGSSSSQTGFLVDSAVANVDYDCLADNEYNKTTQKDGSFSCKHMNDVRFRIGSLVLAEMKEIPEDGYVFPYDFFNLKRDVDIMDKQVIAMAQLLQSLDEDHNASNGIYITDSMKAKMKKGYFQVNDFMNYINNAEVELVDEDEAFNHLVDTLEEYLHNKAK